MLEEEYRALVNLSLLIVDTKVAIVLSALSRNEVVLWSMTYCDQRSYNITLYKQREIKSKVAKALTNSSLNNYIENDI